MDLRTMVQVFEIGWMERAENLHDAIGRRYLHFDMVRVDEDHG
jgi:hypothetical protein